MSFTSATSFRWRDVYLAAAARGVAACGTFGAVTALVLTLQPVSGYAVSALILASTVPVVVLAPVAGRLADRVDSRALLIAVGAAQVVIAAVLAFSGQVVAIIALMALLGAGQAVIGPTLAALTPSMVSREDLPRASAINQTASMIGMLTGPAVAGVLVGTHGVRVPLLLNAVGLASVVVAGLLVRTRRGSGPAGSGAPEPAEIEPAAPPRWRFRQDPLLRAMVLSLAAVIAAVGAMNVVEVFLVRGTLGASEATYGLLEVVWTAGVLAGTWWLARAARRARDDGALVYALLMTLGGLSAAVAVAATVGSAAWLVPLWIAGGACNGGLNVYANVLLARRVPEPVRGRAYATLGATVHGAGMAGYAAGGPLVERLPIQPLVAGIGLAGLVVVGLLALPVLRAVRRERGSAEPVGLAAVAGA